MPFQIICTESLQWLQKQADNSIHNFVTGIPDLNELHLLSNDEITIDKYVSFFNVVAELILQKVRDDGYCIFIQTDRKINGQLIDKSYFLTNIAYKLGFKLVWHKIVCQREVGKKDLFRPTYSHFLCYTQKGTPGVAFEDVLPVGGKLYENGTPINAANAAATFLSKQIIKQKKNLQRENDTNKVMFDVVDPFVGQGTIGVSMISENLSFLGIDVDAKQCELSTKLLKQFDKLK